jgi:DNA polymerase III delta subunit
MSASVMSLELPQSLARSGVMPLYAVVGEEDYLRDQSVAALRAAALGPGGGYRIQLRYFSRRRLLG